MRTTWQQQEPTPPLQRGSRKQAFSNPDQDGSRKQHKVAQIRENQLPQITTSSQADADLLEDLLPLVIADTDQESRFVERSWGVMEMCWAASRQDSGSHFDGKGSDNHGKDEEEEGGDRDRDEKDKDKGDEDKDEEDEDKDKDEDENKDKNEDEDEDKDSSYESEIPGISNWYLLGKDFECEAAALGLFSSYKFFTKLTTLQMESLWENWTLVYFVNIHLK